MKKIPIKKLGYGFEEIVKKGIDGVFLKLEKAGFELIESDSIYLVFLYKPTNGFLKIFWEYRDRKLDLYLGFDYLESSRFPKKEFYLEDLIGILGQSMSIEFANRRAPLKDQIDFLNEHLDHALEFLMNPDPNVLKALLYVNKQFSMRQGENPSSIYLDGRKFLLGLQKAKKKGARTVPRAKS